MVTLGIIHIIFSEFNRRKYFTFRRQLPCSDLVNYNVFYQDKNIGYIQFRPANGQIGLIYVDEHYRRRGIGREMLKIAHSQVKTEYLWAVTIKDHYFWSNIPGMVWCPDSPHKSVLGHGYKVKTDNPDFVEWLGINKAGKPVNREDKRN
jgi:GNAT superfamily N-acetyltransferase